MSFTETVRHPFDPNKQIVVTEKCPNCHSLFISNDVCESCGYNFKVDLVGDPFGKRSFFEIQSQFQDSLSYFERKLSHPFFYRKEKIIRHKRHLKHRGEILLNYFFHIEENNRKKRKLHLFEAKELIKEYIIFGGDQEWLWKQISLGESHPFYPELLSCLKENVSIKNQVFSYKDEFLNFRLWNWLEIRFILMALICFGAFIFVSLFFYEYLLIYLII
jgi:hypothetical protein